MGKWVLYTQSNYVHSKPAQNHPFNTPNLTWLALPTTHIFRFDLSLPLSLIRHSTPFHYFNVDAAICYQPCETKMKRSQIGVRRRISRLLCVKSTSFSFFFPVRYLISGQNPIYIPVWLKLVRYNRYLNNTKHHYFCTSVRTSTKYTGHTCRYGTKLSSLIICIICTYLIKIIRWVMI